MLPCAGVGGNSAEDEGDGNKCVPALCPRCCNYCVLVAMNQGNKYG